LLKHRIVRKKCFLKTELIFLTSEKYTKERNVIGRIIEKDLGEAMKKQNLIEYLLAVPISIFLSLFVLSFFNYVNNILLLTLFSVVFYPIALIFSVAIIDMLF